LDDLIRRLDQQLIATETVVQRLMTIWRGPFLPGQNASDTVAKRLSLSAKFIRVMTQIVQTLIQENKPESAIQTIRKAIEVEPLAEHLHHQLIKVLLDQGRPLEALAAYQLYESIHHNHLGHQPSETLTSCQTLLKNANNR
jgi:DNA-binding SARP family transcriptional activator